MTNAEVIIKNLQDLIDNYEIMKRDVEQGDDPYQFYEYESDLTWQIDCHPIFKNDRPCLLEERKIKMDNKGLYKIHCEECKAMWLMDEYQE